MAAGGTVGEGSPSSFEAEVRAVGEAMEALKKLCQHAAIATC